MKSILLIGLGRFGIHIAKKLDELKCQVLAVDHNEDRVDAALPYVRNAQIGDSTNEEFLRSLGVRDFDECIVAIGNDFQSSLETTDLLKVLGAKHVISRASRDVHAKFLLRNGADEVIYPEKQVANWTAIRCSSDTIFDYMDLGDDSAIFEVAVPAAWAGKTLQQLDVRKKYNINVLARREHGHLKMPVGPTTEMKLGESILVLGRNEEIERCFKI